MMKVLWTDWLLSVVVRSFRFHFPLCVLFLQGLLAVLFSVSLLLSSSLLNVFFFFFFFFLLLLLLL